MIITIVGGGNGGHVLAGIAGAHPGVEVRLLTRRPKAFSGREIRVERPGIGGGPTMTGTIDAVSSDPASVLPGSHLVVWCGPVVATRDVFADIAPYVQPTASHTTYVGCLFAQGCVHLMARQVLGRTVPFFALQSIPWLCRTLEAGKACEIVGCKKYTNLACTARVNFTWLRRAFEPLCLVPLVRLADFAAIVLNPANQIIHPARYWGIFKDWDGSTPIAPDCIPWLYRDFDDASAEALTGLDDELQRIKKDLLVLTPELDLEPIKPLQERIIAQYGDQVADKRTLKSTMATNQAYSMAKTPVKPVAGGVVPNAEHRVVQDDIPHGLCVLKDIAQQLAHRTPWIDRMIIWHQELMGKEYLVEGHLSGRHMSETSCLSALGGECLAQIGLVERPEIPCKL